MTPSKVIHDYLAGIGRRGGSSTSKAKAAAARANGRKGGRPRKDDGRRCKTCFNRAACKIGGPLCNCVVSCSAYVLDTRLAKQPSLKQSRTGRSSPASVGRGPS